MKNACRYCGYVEADHNREHGNAAACREFTSGPKTTSKHTPGPWSIEKHGRAGRLIEGPGFISPVLVGNIFDHRSGSADRVPQEEIQTANARLIAAAPEMYDALRDAVTLLNAVGYVDGDIVDAARAVIAKVEGRTP